MHITQSKEGSLTIVALNGRLDTLSSESLDKELKQLTDNSVNKILIDFSNLEFISSSGLRVLLTTAKSVKATDGKLALCALQQHVKEVFDVAGFTMLFAIFNSQQEAISGLQ